MPRFVIIPTLLLCFLAGCDQPKIPSSTATTTTTLKASYVGSEQCQNCHQTEQQQWRGSDHHQAMKLATSENIVGNFSAPPLKHHQQKTTFNTVDGQYHIQTDQDTPTASDLTLQYTFGVFPLQQYLTALPNGRWQSLPFAWDARSTAQGGQHWFHLYANENIVPNDVLHWRSPSHNANHMCIECHTTDFKKNYQTDSDSFQSTWVETGVGCESCHGPGSKHLAWRCV